MAVFLVTGGTQAVPVGTALYTELSPCATHYSALLATSSLRPDSVPLPQK